MLVGLLIYGSDSCWGDPDFGPGRRDFEWERPPERERFDSITSGPRQTRAPRTDGIPVYWEKVSSEM